MILTAGLIVNVRKPSTSPDIKHRLQKISFQLDILSLFNHTAIDGGPQVDFLIFFSFFWNILISWLPVCSPKLLCFCACVYHTFIALWTLIFFLKFYMIGCNKMADVIVVHIRSHSAKWTYMQGEVGIYIANNKGHTKYYSFGPPCIFIQDGLCTISLDKS